MMNFKHALIILTAFLILVLTGCNLFDSNTTYFQITTDRDVYSSKSSPEIIVEAVNISGRTLYQAIPGSAILEVLENDEWVAIGAWYMTAGISKPREIKPDCTAHIPALFTNSEFMESSKSYRIKASIYRDEDLKRRIPLNQQVSNPFKIKE